MRKISELMNMKGRSAIVTGGAGHIGLAICEALMEAGAKVSVWDRQKEATVKRCNELNRRGYLNKAYPVVMDLSQEDSIREFVEYSKKKMGGIDVVVHSAAFIAPANSAGWMVAFEEQDMDSWNKAMQIHLNAAFVLVQSANKYLKRSKSGSVIFVSSIYGIVGPDWNLYEGTKMGNAAAYGVSKAGLNQLAKYLSTTLAPHVRVNVISPGGVWRKPNEDFHKRYKKRTPLARMATEEDIKGAVLFLASGLSNYVTGQNIIVDGGYTAW